VNLCEIEQKNVLAREQARSQVRHFRAVGKQRGVRERLRAYCCQFCGGWHIGHGQRRRRRHAALQIRGGIQ